MSNTERAPVQGDLTIRRDRPGHDAGTIAWSEHEEVWRAYDKKWRCGQSAKRIAERGGFGYREIVDLTGAPPKTWQPIAQEKT